MGTNTYRLIDSGDGRKLEQFGPYTLNRPCTQAVWTKTLQEKGGPMKKESLRIDEMVKDRHQCELACKERDNQSKERDSDLKEKIWKTSGIIAGAINVLVEGIKWTISKLI